MGRNIKSWIKIISLFLFVGCSSVGHKKGAYNGPSFDGVSLDKNTGKCDYKLPVSFKKAIKYANACAAKSKWKEVHDLAVYIRSVDEKAPWGYFYDSLYFSSRSQHNQSLWYAQKALERDYNNYLLNYQLARIYHHLGDMSHAMSYMKTSYKLKEDFYDANLFLAENYFNNKMYQDAYKHYLKIVYKGDDDIYQAIYIAALNLSKYDEALSYLNKISTQKMTNFNWIDRAYLYEKLGKIDKALYTYQSVLKQNKWKNTSYNKQQLSDKIRELQVQQRSVATAGSKNKKETN